MNNVPAEDSASVPAQPPTEPKEEIRVPIDSETSFAYTVEYVSKSEYAADVEAAFREGWKRGYETPRDRKLSGFREDWGWDDSDAKERLEGR
jgi:hypothetical protein